MGAELRFGNRKVTIFRTGRLGRDIISTYSSRRDRGIKEHPIAQEYWYEIGTTLVRIGKNMLY
jgi:hypothetical protein